VEEYLAKRNRRGPDPSAMTFGAGGASEDAGASLADDWLEETFGRVNETRRAGRANPEAWTTASVPALLSAFPEFSTEALSTRDETRVPPPTKVPFLSFASVSEALAAYPVRPRLRCVAFPFFFFRHSSFVVFRRTKAKIRRGDDTYTFITSR
jgi:nuclear cap-binding protein subunit 1